MRGVYRLPGFAPVELGLDPDWTEDPFRDANWVIRFQGLRWTRHLIAAWEQTGDPRYLLRWRDLLADWVADNPRNAPASPHSWDDHATAFRGMVLSCASQDWVREPWLLAAMTEHGRTLADQRFYVKRGNHAVDQTLGLLALGCVTPRPSWIALSEKRMLKLVGQGIDEQGATDEGAPGYALYNHDRYSEALLRFAACDRPAPQLLRHRTALLEAFISRALLPDGSLAPIGDTRRRAKVQPKGPATSFALNRQGERPNQDFAIYRAGWAFGRSSWSNSAFMYSLRFGRQYAIHGHADIGSLTMTVGARDIVTDGGIGTYRHPGSDPKWRDHFVGPEAHNLLIPGGSKWYRSAKARLVAQEHIKGVDLYVLSIPSWSGVKWRRTILISRMDRTALVLDEASSKVRRSWRQVWHLAPSTQTAIQRSSASLRLYDDRLAHLRVSGARRIRMVKGWTDPVRGWLSLDYGHRQPAPQLEAVAFGSRVRMLTSIGMNEPRRLVASRDGFRAMLPSAGLVSVSGTRLSVS